MKNIYLKSVVLMVALMAVLSAPVYADRHDHDRHDRSDRSDRSDKRDRGDRHERSQPDFRFDSRYHHDRRYPRDGYVVRTLPERRHIIHYRNKEFFYFGGVWYRPSGPGFVVIRPPIGIIVPVLPSFYTTVWLHGTPYYYANDVYYVWRPDLNGYEVTNPPAAATTAEPPLVADELYIYPKKGQSEQQQADDRYACHQWGVKQSGYDPTQPPTTLSTSELNSKRENYQRAMKACLEGRGYSVR